VEGGRAPIVVLDDDPTGVQTLAGVRALLAWSPARIADAVKARPAVHVITNSRALSPHAAGELVRRTAGDAVAGAPEAHVVLRGDSTLRGHLLEEYDAVRAVTHPGVHPALMLAPALPSAGRVTVGGVHLIERDNRRVPLHETEYAHDGPFAYRDARLLRWAEERSGGYFDAADGRELPLADLRSGGAPLVAAALAELAAPGRPAILAPDAETPADLELLAAGYAEAVGAGVPALVRCAPAFAGILCGTTAAGLVDAPRAESGVLVVCGSYVPASRRQLARLLEGGRHALVEVDVAALASGRRGPEIERASRAVDASRRRGRAVVLATPAERPRRLSSLDAGGRIARGVAAVVAALDEQPDVVVAKGGVTSAVTLQHGLGVDEAEVVGPVLPGVSRWRAVGRRGDLDYLVVPGNVGDADLLVALVERVLRD
jgi:uncharacterized protein YgbK (DUF1537 family)